MAKSSLLPIVLTVGAIALAFPLNPSAEKHREKITEAISARSQVERLLGIGHVASFVSQYHSLGVASYSTINNKLISIGAYGMVFVTD